MQCLICQKLFSSCDRSPTPLGVGSIHNDIKKNEIAKKNNIKLIRIRENEFPKDINSLLI